MAVATVFDGERSRKSKRPGWLRAALVGAVRGDTPGVRTPPSPPPFIADFGDEKSDGAAGKADAPAGAASATDASTAAAGQAPLSRNAYLRGLEEVIRRTEREEVQETLVSVSPVEVQRLVRKAAKAKARYLAATLDTVEGDSLPDAAAIRALEAARERHEALEAGLQNLLAEMRRGNVDIAGIDDDGAHALNPDY